MKLKEGKIDIRDIAEYASQNSDFAFELCVAHEVQEVGLRTTHCGIYNDPVTNIAREYDIRCVLPIRYANIEVVLYLAVECKNIRENYPFVVHCVNRDIGRAYQNAVYTPASSNLPPDPYTFLRNQQIVLRDREGFYTSGGEIGLAMDQVGRDRDNGKIVCNDEKVYHKISQAVSSMYDLVRKAANNILDVEVVSLIYPLLVIPEGRMFAISYNADYSPTQPREVKHVSFYSGQEFNVLVRGNSRIVFQVSHIDVITIDYIKTHIQNLKHVMELQVQNKERIRNAYMSGNHTLD